MAISLETCGTLYASSISSFVELGLGWKTFACQSLSQCMGHVLLSSMVRERFGNPKEFANSLALVKAMASKTLG